MMSFYLMIQLNQLTILFLGLVVGKCQAFYAFPNQPIRKACDPGTLSLTTHYAVNFNNFWMATTANFTVCDEPDRPHDFESRSGSKYWNGGDRVIRKSDHWSGQHGCYRIVDCMWYINQEHAFEETLTGECDFSDFETKKRKGRKTLQQRGVVVRKTDERVSLVKIKIDFDNFWRSTQAHFVSHEYPKDREPDFQSKSGSMYWDDGDGVIRLSDHWTGQHGVTQIVDCRWTIDTPQPRVKQPISGKCLYEDFAKRNRKRTKAISWRKISR